MELLSLLSDMVISKVAPDLSEYWNEESDFGTRIRERVRNAICEVADSDSRVMLVTHCLGSIVAYDVLWQLSNDPEYKDRFDGRKIDAFCRPSS